MPLTKPTLSVGTAGAAARGALRLPQWEHARDRTGRGEQVRRGFGVLASPRPGRRVRIVGRAVGQLTPGRLLRDGLPLWLAARADRAVGGRSPGDLARCN